jgi:hypothetical protein
MFNGEFKIGEVFQCGLLKLKVVEASNPLHVLDATLTFLLIVMAICTVLWDCAGKEKIIRMSSLKLWMEYDNRRI